MRLYYIATAEGPNRYVRSALGVDAERWNDLFDGVCEWRRALDAHRSVPVNADLREHPGTEIVVDGLRLVEEAAGRGGVEVINVCLPRRGCGRQEQVSLDRLLNRINASANSAGRYAFLIFEHGDEEMITRAFRRMRTFNPVPNRHYLWGEGERMRNMPIERVIGDPAFRAARGDYLLQLAGLIARALLAREEYSVQRASGLGSPCAFSVLDRALNRKASRDDPWGVVRR